MNHTTRESSLWMGTSPEDEEVSSEEGKAKRRMSRTQLGAGGILDVSIEALFACFLPCVGVAALFWLPYSIWSDQLVGSEDLLELFSSATLRVIPESSALLLCSYVVGRTLYDRPSGGMVALYLRLLPTLFLCVIPCLLLTQVSIVCCVPFFILMGYCALLMPILAFEPQSRGFLRAWTYAVPRAVRLGSGGGTLVRFLLWFLVVHLIFGSLLNSLSGVWSLPEAREMISSSIGVSEDGLRIVFICVSTFLSAVSTSLYAAASTVHYFDLRTRKEGFDLELHLRSMESVREEIRATPA